MPNQDITSEALQDNMLKREVSIKTESVEGTAVKIEPVEEMSKMDQPPSSNVPSMCPIKDNEGLAGFVSQYGSTNHTNYEHADTSFNVYDHLPLDIKEEKCESDLDDNEGGTSTTPVLVAKGKTLAEDETHTCHMRNDIHDNIMEYHVVGSVSRMSMKPGCAPTMHQCQQDRRKRTSHATQPRILKKHRKTLIEKDLKERTATIKQELGEITSSSCYKYAVPQARVKNISQDAHKTVDRSIQILTTRGVDKSIQVLNKSSKAVQTEANLVDQMTSPSKHNHRSVSTSPFTIESYVNPKPSTSIHDTSREILTSDEATDSEISDTPSPTGESSSSTASIPRSSSTSDCSELNEDDTYIQYTLIKISRCPLFYIGVPKCCYYLIETMKEVTGIPANDIIMCLNKIRLHYRLGVLADDFSTTSTNVREILQQNIPLIASVMRPFLVKLDKESIERNKYSNVTCIVDCLEIEIQRSTKAPNLCPSWSQVKKANIIKYLVSCTPDGLVNYVSPGYGGGVTEASLVETCDFIQCLQPGMCVMADRRFEHVEPYLRKGGVQLVLYPSEKTGAKLSKSEATTKQFASVRSNGERVIRRLREFNILKHHACVNHRLVKVLDDIMIIACGLINIHDSLIG